MIELHTGTVVKNFIDGKIIETIQNEKKATFGCSRNLNDCFIDFSFDTELMQRYFNALTHPYPLPRIRIKIHEGYLIISELRTENGQYTNPRTLVKTGYHILKGIINDY